MKRFLLIPILLISFLNGYSQSTETSLYLREELVRQRDDLLKQAQGLQKRIDAIDQRLGNKGTSTTERKYLTKAVKYNSENNYSNSFENTPNKKKQYKSRTTRTYHRGSRGGCYYINSNGNKTYVARSMCN